MGKGPEGVVTRAGHTSPSLPVGSRNVVGLVVAAFAFKDSRRPVDAKVYRLWNSTVDGAGHGL